MTEQRNGSMRLAYWLMGALLTVAIGLGGLWANDLHGRIVKLESEQGNYVIDIRILREQVCRLEEKVDSLREDVTNKPVHRLPCP